MTSSLEKLSAVSQPVRHRLMWLAIGASIPTAAVYWHSMALATFISVTFLMMWVGAALPTAFATARETGAQDRVRHGGVSQGFFVGAGATIGLAGVAAIAATPFFYTGAAFTVTGVTVLASAVIGTPRDDDAPSEGVASDG